MKLRGAHVAGLVVLGLCMIAGVGVWHTWVFPAAVAPAFASTPAVAFEPGRFAVTTLLFGDSPLYRGAADTLQRSVRRYATGVDLVAFQDERSPAVAGWRSHRVNESDPLYAKLLIWSLTQYEAVLFLDLDTLVVGSIAPLFLEVPAQMRAARRTAVAAVHDRPLAPSLRFNWAGHGFNAGVMLALPDRALYQWLEDGRGRIVFDNSMREQNYLNQALGNQWFQLDLKYNLMTIVAYVTGAEWNALVAAGEPRILHYTWPKPWHDCAALGLAGVCALWRSEP